MRTLILGAEGLLGRAVAREWRRRGATCWTPSRRQLDVTDPAGVRFAVRDRRPELLVNCAAFTRVDECEARPELAMAVNGAAVAHLVAAARPLEARLIQLSTDYVFDGEAREPYPENAPTRPLSAYGRSKLRGEEEALAYEGSLVVRTSWLFGPGGANFVSTIRRRAAESREPLPVVSDQVGCPTYSRYLAGALWQLGGLRTTGIVHYRNRDPVSWHGFAARILDMAPGRGEVVPVITAEMPRPAPRPAYSVLSVDRAESLLGRRVEAWEDGLAEYLRHLEGES